MQDTEGVNLMVQKIPSPHSLSTGIGALPFLDPVRACDTVLGIYKDIPYIPTLPNRDLLESIVFCDSSVLPGKVIHEGRLYVDTKKDTSAGMEQIYIDFMEGSSQRYALSADYASAFAEMMHRNLSGSMLLKCQVTGPVTFGMQVVDCEKRPVYYDDQFADVLSKMTALRAMWCEKAMRDISGVRETLVVLNEPYLAALGSSVIPIDRDIVISGWNDISSLVAGGLGIHCCSNTDWNFIISLKPSVISFDAYTGAREFLLYMDDIISYMEKGGVIAWGIVPADPGIFSQESPTTLIEKYCAIRKQVVSVMDPGIFDAQSIITPTCGIRFADEPESRAIMEASVLISRHVRGLPGS
jgi:hypothetical protein